MAGNENNWEHSNVKAFNGKLFADAIGFSVYSFEGIGIIIPVKDITANKENYFSVLTAVLVFITACYIFFGLYTAFAWNLDGESPLITDYLPKNNAWVWVINLLFCINLFISYTLMIWPANMVIESYLYAGWPKSKKR